MLEPPNALRPWTDAGAGVDSAWEQKKLEVTRSEILDAKRAAESPASSARFVGRR
jgi:hypothetical protein